MLKYVGTACPEIFGTRVNEDQKKEFFEKTGIKLQSSTKVLHFFYNDIHEYTGGTEPDRFDEIWNFIDMDYYNNIMHKNMNKIIALRTLGFRDTNDQRYDKIMKLANHDISDLSTYDFLVWEKGEYKLVKNGNRKIYFTVYDIEDFEQFLIDTGSEPKKTKTKIKKTTTNCFLLDISTIKDEHNERFPKVFRLSNTIRKNQILDNSFVEYENGIVTFHHPDENYKKRYEEKCPGQKIFDSKNEDVFYSLIGKRVPKTFIKDYKYIVRDFDGMKLEYGINNDGDKLNNHNRFPFGNKDLCGIEFTSDGSSHHTIIDGSSHNTVSGRSIFPEETYEVSNMANTTDNVNIFSGDEKPVPPEKVKVKITKVGNRYFRADNTEIEDTAHIEGNDDFEVETIASTNERRYIAALEMGIQYDNLEEKSKRIQEIIKNELDSPEAIKDKEWIYIYGASGSGKTTEAVRYCKDKGLDFIKQAGFGQLTGDDLLGYKSITDGTYFRSLLRDAVEYGKVFIFDEMDACNPNTLLILNELKGEEMQFPDKKVKIHENFRLIATGNTLGFSEDYNARSKLDRATLARFSKIEYNLTLLDLGERWGGKYINQISDVANKEPREIQREVRQLKQKENQNA